MAGTDPSGYVVKIYHPEIKREILAQILSTGDVLGQHTMVGRRLASDLRAGRP